MEVTNKIIQESNLELTEDYRYLFLEKTESYKAQESLFTLAAGESEAQGNLNLTFKKYPPQINMITVRDSRVSAF